MEQDKEIEEKAVKIEDNGAQPEKLKSEKDSDSSEVKADDSDTPVSDVSGESTPTDSAPTDNKEEKDDQEADKKLKASTSKDDEESPSVANDSSHEKADDSDMPVSDVSGKSAPTDSAPTDNKEEKDDQEADKELKASAAKDDKESPSVAKADESVKEESLESENDLKEKDDDEDHEDEDDDYSHFSKEELVSVIKELAKSDNVILAEKKAREVKHFFDEFREKDREEALQKFIADGGEEKDFSFRNDELTLRFDANYQLVRDRKYQYTKNREQQKEQNLKKKEDILEQLRDFVDSEETNISFETFKKFQEEWKSIGPVPGAYARTMWANYNALIDRFYDNRSIYFELKELDRKKNLEAKLELCERAEALIKMDQITEAVKELNELHHEFKHIGPVPKDEQEPLWQRFKAASDAVYDRRKEFVDKLKGELEENMKIKSALAEEVAEFEKFDSDRIKAWNERTKALLEIQKKWENTGGLPRAHAKEINRKFWSAFKTFFSNKNQFFKKLDAEREENLRKKQEMVKQAEALKDNEDMQATAEKLKELQREWREIGPVPGKYRETVYKAFKSACDAFFDRKRASKDESSKEYEVNLEKKKDICRKIEALAKGDGDHVEKFKKYQEEYNDTGFVPKRNIGEIKDMYSKAVDKYIKSLEGLDDDQKEKLRIENEVSDILHSPNADQKLYRKEQSLRKQISTIENDIAIWKNNMEFFAESKKANKLKDEFQHKIDSATDELQHLKKQLRIIRTMDS